jgi:protein TonB
MTGIHLAVVLIIFFVGVFQRLTNHTANQEITTFVSIADPPPTFHAIEEPALPPEPKPVVTPEPEPQPVVTPPPKPKKEIAISKTKVTRPNKPDANPPPPKPSASKRISQQLASLKKPQQAGQKSDLPVSYYSHVKQVVYAEWGREKPSRDAVMQGAVATVSITVDRNGRITNRRLQRQSGSPVLDASALRAVRKVRTLKPLPSSFSGKSKVITIDFELTG